MGAEPAATPALVLLDLDGTLADTLPDLAWALDRALADHGLGPGDAATVRARVSAGAGAMVEAALAGRRADAQAVHRRFLEIYGEQVGTRSRLFEGMDRVLAALERAGRGMGIVTNKVTAFTAPLVRSLGLEGAARCVVCGDTTPRSKPHPQPLLHAAGLAGVAPSHCVYVGDARDDVTASRAAGMPVAAAGWGYLAPGDDPHRWRPDVVLEHPLELLRWLSLDP